jgi:hypothetical protein
LKVNRIADGRRAPVIDGNPSDGIWKHAKTVVVKTVKGIHNPKDDLDVSVTALHDGKQIYFRFQWDDPDLSVKHFPLLKTPQGWIVMQTALEQNSEDVYHEDKLAVYITKVRNNRGCASSCHLGDGAQGNPKGVHYTNGEIADLWEWRAIGTEPTGSPIGELGYLIDEYIGPPRRKPMGNDQPYSGGFAADPGVGGYRENFVKLDPDKPISEARVRPIMVPPMLRANLTIDPETTEPGGPWWIFESMGIPYSEQRDHFPVWSALPNVLVAPFQGDRADLSGRATWKKGRP